MIMMQTAAESQPITTYQLLDIWKTQLIFEVTAGGRSVQTVGLVDGGSRLCVVSRRIARMLELQIMPFVDGRPELTGFDGHSKHQPIGFITPSINQLDLGLAAKNCTLLVVQHPTIDLILGSHFNLENDTEGIIIQKVRGNIMPRYWSNDISSLDSVLVLIDSRNKKCRNSEHEEKRKQVQSLTRSVWSDIQEFKENQERQRSTWCTASGSNSRGNYLVMSSSTREVLASQDTTTTSSCHDSSTTSAASSSWTVLKSQDSASSHNWSASSTLSMRPKKDSGKL